MGLRFGCHQVSRIGVRLPHRSTRAQEQRGLAIAYQAGPDGLPAQIPGILSEEV